MWVLQWEKNQLPYIKAMLTLWEMSLPDLSPSPTTVRRPPKVRPSGDLRSSFRSTPTSSLCAVWKPSLLIVSDQRPVDVGARCQKALPIRLCETASKLMSR